jgi:PKD repeat protein
VDATTSGSADPDGSIVATVLNFGDGTIVNNPSAIHTYAKPGEYLATATVTDNQGASAQATATVRLAASPNLPPIAVLTVAPSTGLGPLTVDATTSGSADPDGTIVATVLNFGDGTILNNPSATHTYARPGEYLVTATVIDNQGASAQATATVRLAGRDQEFGERDHERGDCSGIACK